MNENATRLAEVLKRPLYVGAHKTTEKMCIMEAVAYVAGERHTDSPKCASGVISVFMRTWNDELDDRERLKPYIERLANSAASPEVEQKRGLMAASWYLTVFAPAWVELAGHTAHANMLRDAVVTSWGDMAKREGKWSAARSAARSAAENAAGSAARSAAGSAAWRAAGSAVESAAWRAVENVAWRAVENAAWSAARSAAESAVESAAESAVESAAWRAARSAATKALEPTVTKLQESAFRLVDAMLEVSA